MPDNLTWFITGTSRGIGLEFVRQLVAEPTNLVIATCRTPDKATELNDLKSGAKGELHILPLDTSSMEAIEGVVGHVQGILGDRGLDYLINNAAVNLADDRAFNFKPDDLLKTFNVNVVGPAHLAQVLLPFIEKSQKKFILNFSTGLASMGLDHEPKAATYSISKTGISMLTHKQAKTKPELTVIAVDPGWVKTVMGGAGALIEPAESVEALLALMARSTPAESGKFFTRTGTEIPW
ncbi:C-factor [Irpex rosettiformis]|uniref:C-factor n=1 Tax=Irpex rosettiformis TaxID=378272 RepID=A0ACB8TNW1_9APHY|nr:C-factor [Irpex rosettiformis]